MRDDPLTMGHLNSYVRNTAKAYKLTVGSNYKLYAKAN